MKIRDFLKGVDPEACESGSFYRNGAPFCPLSHAGANHGYSRNDKNGPLNESGLFALIQKLGINTVAYNRFWDSFDTSYRQVEDRTSAFNHALAAAEKCELKAEEQEKPPK